MKIDAYSHILPQKYINAILKKAPSFSYARKLSENFPALTDMSIRFRTMDRYQDFVQVIAIRVPPVEDVLGPKETAELARIANDEMAELVARYPDRFVAAVACLPLNNIDAALKEIDRAITELRFRGIQLYSVMNGKPMGSEEFMPIYEKMAYYNLPILIHPVPSRVEKVVDYTDESESEHLGYMIFGWPYSTSLAMTSLIFGAGIFETFPNIKFLVHHCGAMVPFFGERISAAIDGWEMRMGYKHKRHLTKRPLDYYRMFYGDTAVSGSTPALMCGYAFFSAKHMLFATDMPLDSQLGYRPVRQAILAVDQMDISDDEKKKIYEDNAKEFYRLPL